MSAEGNGPSQALQLVAMARERYQLVMSEDGRPYGLKRVLTCREHLAFHTRSTGQLIPRHLGSAQRAAGRTMPTVAVL